MKTINRVMELMKENKMDFGDKKLFFECAIIYETAQSDLLKQQLKDNWEVEVVNVEGKNEN